MSHEPLMDAAGRIADGQDVDWASITSTAMSDADRALADELALVARIAQGHRQLHELLPAASDTATALAPDRARWGHLDLLNVVGRGSYGTVYRAWDTRLERLVALKLFHGAPDPEAVMREGRMLARVRHEHVVTVYGADVIDGTAGLWMELVHGRTLDRMIKDQGPMDAREAAAIGLDVSRALAAVHEASVLHCDVKAQNVVREAGGRVVLMDLGAGCVAPEARDSDQLSDVAGTPRYMAPELFHAGASPTRASDIYSLGVLLYYLVSGKFPVDGHSLGELKRAHAVGRITPLASLRADLPASYVDIVTTALDPAAERRPASANAVCAALLPVAEPPEPGPDPPRSLGRWAAAAVGVLVLGLAVVRPLVSPSAPAVPEVRSIAVLPIRNLTGDESKAYVADGLTEVLVSNLARVRSLRVPSVAAVAGLRNPDEPPAAMAKKLGVQMLLAGSVTQADSRVRLNIRLIDAAGVVVWGEEINRDKPGVLSAQVEIARVISQRLALPVTNEEFAAEAQARLAPEAQDAYLRGLSLAGGGPAQAIDSARHFRRAVEIEPQFAAAWAQLALVEDRFINTATGIDRRTRAAFAREMAEKAIDLDPSLPMAHAALGNVLFYHEWDYPAAERAFRRALELGPSYAFARQRFAMFLAALGRLDEALAFARESRTIEPLNPARTHAVAFMHYYRREHDQAIVEMRRALSLSPGFPVAHFGLGRIYSALGRQDEAATHIEEALKAGRTSGYLVELARVYTAAGRTDDAKRVMAELVDREKQGEGYNLDNLAYIAVADGRIDEAFAILEQARQQRMVNMLWIRVDPRVDALRGDPRFLDLLKRMGLE